MKVKTMLKERIINWKCKHFHKTKAGKNLKKHKGIHAGESCFLIGNGPSLRVEDLDRIEALGIPTFAFNRIYHIFDQTKWRPTYYISQDERMLAGCVDEVNQMQLPHKFTPANARWFFNVDVKQSEDFYLEGAEDLEFWFSDDISKSLCWASTVMYTAAQFAAYMGFKNIYLLGVDHHFHISRNKDGEIVVDDTVKDYFCDKYNEDKENIFIPNTDISTYTYISMKKHCDERNINVYNATRGGKLEVFPRVDLDNVLGNKIVEK